MSYSLRTSWYINATTDLEQEKAEELISVIVNHAMEKALSEGLITWYDLDCQVNECDEEE